MVARRKQIKRRNYPVVEERWYQRAWRPAAAGVYLAICLVDFIFMPLYYEIDNTRLRPTNLVELALRFEGGAAQVEALRAIRNTRAWVPLTLQESGLFHIAFGAILTGAAITRGFERREVIRRMESGGGDVLDVVYEEAPSPRKKPDKPEDDRKEPPKESPKESKEPKRPAIEREGGSA